MNKLAYVNVQDIREAAIYSSGKPGRLRHDGRGIVQIVSYRETQTTWTTIAQIGGIVGIAWAFSVVAMNNGEILIWEFSDLLLLIPVVIPAGDAGAAGFREGPCSGGGIRFCSLGTHARKSLHCVYGSGSPTCSWPWW
jgi:hypothetical protein